MKAKLLLIGLAMSLFALSSVAQESVSKIIEAKRSCFVDNDKNGLCDSFESGTCTIGNGKGLMDGSGNRQGLRDGSGARRRDGSCLSDNNTVRGRGNATYRQSGRNNSGPKDGSGNRSNRGNRGSRGGNRPMDGTGYGAEARTLQGNK